MNRAALCLGILQLLLAGSASAQQWSRFRGPNGAGVSTAKTIPTKWGAADFNWRIKLPGVGHCSPVLWGKRIFVMSGDEKTGERILTCHAIGDGSELWRKSYETKHHRKHALNSFASTTPVVDARRVYYCWTNENRVWVTALDHNGREQWRSEVGEFRSGHGWGASPILFEDQLILVCEHGGQSFVTALDAASGKPRWRKLRETGLNYATPCLVRRQGATELVVTNWKLGITALNPRNGEQIWRADVFDKKHVESSIGSPIVADDLVLGVCGWLGYGNELIAVRPTADGKAKQVYRIGRGAPLCTTPVVAGDLLFLWSDNGIATCADSQTGEVHWRKRVGGSYYASPVVVDGRLFNVSTEGKVTVLAAAKQFKELAENSLGESSHSTPAVVDGVMYWRTFTHLLSLGGEKYRRQ